MFTQVMTLHQDAIARAASELLASVTVHPWGQFSPSVYETARVVSLAPWLTGHPERIQFLLDSQQPDGSWGGADGYGLVPTLSATEALLTTLRRSEAGLVDHETYGYRRLVRTTRRGLAILSGWLGNRPAIRVPDTCAAELIVPGLVAELNVQLTGLRDDPLVGLDAWQGTPGLCFPPGMDDGRLSSVRAQLRAGAAIPQNLWHVLEAIGDPARGARSIRPEETGTVGCSPAATLTWLGAQPVSSTTERCTRYLQLMAEDNAGPMPVVAPLPVFERAWVLGLLAGVRTSLPIPPELVTFLRSAVGAQGAPGGAGLPPDADTTGATLYALAERGVRVSPGCLSAYAEGDHFFTYPDERNPSPTANAHVLEGIAAQLALDQPTRKRFGPKMAAVSAWLREQQETDGSWTDKWHASPYYATACCVRALGRFGTGDSRPALHRASDWVLAGQRANGSWGRWSGTIEETSYAVHILLGAGCTAPDPVVRQAATRGYAYLLDHDDLDDQPRLWHDKDLYMPFAIVRAARLAALDLALRTVPELRDPVAVSAPGGGSDSPPQR